MLQGGGGVFFSSSAVLLLILEYLPCQLLLFPCVEDNRRGCGLAGGKNPVMNSPEILSCAKQNIFLVDSCSDQAYAQKSDILISTQLPDYCCMKKNGSVKSTETNYKMNQITHCERKYKMGDAFVKCLLFKLCPGVTFLTVIGFYSFLDTTKLPLFWCQLTCMSQMPNLCFSNIKQVYAQKS